MPTEQLTLRARQREQQSPQQIATLVARLCQEIIDVCDPQDAAIVAVAIVKTVGELVRKHCGPAAACAMLERATQASEHVHVLIEKDDPGDEGEDPFRIPE